MKLDFENLLTNLKSFEFSKILLRCFYADMLRCPRAAKHSCIEATLIKAEILLK
jgi:hypothetical protein